MHQVIGKTTFLKGVTFCFVAEGEPDLRSQKQLLEEDFILCGMSRADALDVLFNLDDLVSGCRTD